MSDGVEWKSDNYGIEETTSIQLAGGMQNALAPHLHG